MIKRSKLFRKMSRSEKREWKHAVLHFLGERHTPQGIEHDYDFLIKLIKVLRRGQIIKKEDEGRIFDLVVNTNF